MINFIIIILFN